MESQELDGDFNPMSDPEERRHLLSVLDSFRSYRRLAHFNGTHVRRQAFYSLPQDHWNLLSKPPFSVLDSFNKVDDLIDANAELAEAIFVTGFKTFIAPNINNDWVVSIMPDGHEKDEYKWCSTIMDNLDVQPSKSDVDKARSTINLFYREWSTEGAVERDKCFAPIVGTLHLEFASRIRTDPSLDRAELKVLVPGAGLGRLVYDVCNAGFSVEGNEISYHAIMAGAFILNHAKHAAQFSIAPFALNSSNHLSRADQFQTYQIPDIHPTAGLAHITSPKVSDDERMSMSTGDFCVLYRQPKYIAAFDAVATVFFIDTAPNVIRYIEAVRNCLKPGGLWISLGPLLWHHVSKKRTDDKEDEEKKAKCASVDDAGIGDPGSVELTHDEVVALVQHFGFKMEKHDKAFCETGYMSNPKNMLQSHYKTAFWVARKK